MRSRDEHERAQHLVCDYIQRQRQHQEDRANIQSTGLVTPYIYPTLHLPTPPYPVTLPYIYPASFIRYPLTVIKRTGLTYSPQVLVTPYPVTLPYIYLPYPTLPCYPTLHLPTLPYPVTLPYIYPVSLIRCPLTVINKSGPTNSVQVVIG